MKRFQTRMEIRNKLLQMAPPKWRANDEVNATILGNYMQPYIQAALENFVRASTDYHLKYDMAACIKLGLKNMKRLQG